MGLIRKTILRTKNLSQHLLWLNSIQYHPNEISGYPSLYFRIRISVPLMTITDILANNNMASSDKVFPCLSSSVLLSRFTFRIIDLNIQ